MSITSEDVARAMKGGLSIVCATCEHYWERSCPSLQGKCGSPLKGQAFPCYKGAFSETTLSEWCFVCGRLSEYAIELPHEKRRIGVCEKHLYMLQGVRDSSILLHDRAMATLKLGKVIGPPRKTIWQEIHEVEKYFAQKEGREFE